MNDLEKEWAELVKKEAKDIGDRNNYSYQFDYGFKKGTEFVRSNLSQVQEVRELVEHATRYLDVGGITNRKTLREAIKHIEEAL